MTTRTRVAMTYEESAPGVPLWGANTVTTDLLPDQTEVAIENLVAGRTYYIKTWNENEFGTKSPELTSVVRTGTPTRMSPLVFSANGVLDDTSPMYAYIKVPENVLSTKSALISIAFRQFMATARDASSGGGSTSGSGGSSTPTSGASSATSSGSDTTHSHKMFAWQNDAPGAKTSREFAPGGAGGLVTLPTSTASDLSTGTPDFNHTHTIPHTHDVTIGNHTHTTPAHTHSLTYGTFEEAYPASHSVTMTLYKRIAGVWTIVPNYYDTIGITADQFDIDLTAFITGPGDWRISLKSLGGQPNNGRLSADLYGSIIAIIGDGGESGVGSGSGTGATGATGPTGPAGADGRVGADGQDGDEGPMGPPGERGATGSQGIQGVAGPTGLMGPPGFGIDGDDGADGAPGQPGAAGAAGSAGVPGAAGRPGFDGADGDDGERGVPGERGPTGLTGQGGPAGPTGSFLPGSDGDDGADGPPGQPGAAGATGAQGPAGAVGAVIHGIDGDDGDIGPPGMQGMTGLQGIQGIQGIAGPTGLAGPLERGMDGDDGDPGMPGPIGATGPAGQQGPAGAVTLIHGRDGEDGDDGSPGIPPMGWHGAEMHTNITRTLFLPAYAAGLDGATLIAVGASPNLSNAINYADAATSGAYWTFLVPSDWDNGVISIRPNWTPAATDAVAHTVRWSVTAKGLGGSANITAAGTTTAFTGASAARTLDVVVLEAPQSTGVTGSTALRMMLELQRIGADVADTYVGAVRLFGILVEYTANQ